MNAANVLGELAKLMTSGGVEVVEQLPLVTGVSNHNVRYLHAKRSKGHTFDPGDLK